jgi:murein DD-endopeptidase MepM/ murein hydrolase activator NlpD
LIGLGGATGRRTGPHLHWEVWVSGVQVNPVDWLERDYP